MFSFFIQIFFFSILNIYKVGYYWGVFKLVEQVFEGKSSLVGQKNSGNK